MNFLTSRAIVIGLILLIGLYSVTIKVSRIPAYVTEAYKEFLL